MNRRILKILLALGTAALLAVTAACTDSSQGGFQSGTGGTTWDASSETEDAPENQTPEPSAAIDPEALYKPVLDQYRDLISHDFYRGNELQPNGSVLPDRLDYIVPLSSLELEELLSPDSDDSELLYAFPDLDQNGDPELAVGYKTDNFGYDYAFLGFYTHNGEEIILNYPPTAIKTGGFLDYLEDGGYYARYEIGPDGYTIEMIREVEADGYEGTFFSSDGAERREVTEAEYDRLYEELDRTPELSLDWRSLGSSTPAEDTSQGSEQTATVEELAQQYQGSWVVDETRTMQKNGTSIREWFGSAYGDGSTSFLEIGPDGSFSYAIGAGYGGEGTLYVDDGDLCFRITSYETGEEELGMLIPSSDNPWSTRLIMPFVEYSDEAMEDYYDEYEVYWMGIAN